jgi:hypothetical protein
MASSEAFRLSEEELDERDQGFTGPRKSQGPPLEEGEGNNAARAEADAADGVEETPPPEVAPEG